MEVIASAISLRAWHACGCIRNEAGVAPKTANCSQLQPHKILGFRYGRIERKRWSFASAAGPSKTLFNTKRKFEPVASNESRSESSNSGSNVDEDEGEEDEGYEEEAQGVFEENVEVLLRTVMDLFLNYSNRAIRAIREILPPAISTQLIAFGVRGFLFVSLLWVTRALLEVCCSLATYVFGGLFLVRLAWSIIVSAQAGSNSTLSPRGT
ncbi:hypothetical protein R1sor_014346 [Riccia sorocarpa]|uniref:Uncharacterized protein n=1 Tax=Riccia sorocarpa TaxID=122646 RepID=A0ABD3H956_9MARC